MAKAVIINNPIELCDNWGWYVDIESQKIKKFKPIHIVEIFEQYGFIWGGKWYHYDTMHFEYRPELLVD